MVLEGWVSLKGISPKRGDVGVSVEVEAAVEIEVSVDGVVVVDVTVEEE